MRRFTPIFLLLIVLGMFNSPAPAAADGIIIPDPPICHPGPCPMPMPIEQLAIEYHHVTVAIEDQIATTRVDQVFRNDNDWEIEGTYVFPIPEGATLDTFTLWMDGEPVAGEILTRDEARSIYEDIVRTMRDPALLEYVGRAAVQASVYPIPPGGERRIALEYTQVLKADHGLVHYQYPLNTEKFSTEPLEEVSISIACNSRVPIRAVYSPSHGIAIDRVADDAFRAGYEDYNVKPDKDFDLFYSIAEEEVGLNLITFRDPQAADEDGYFLLLAGPSVTVDPDQSIPKDMILVLDQSGSMEGDKFRQAQSAMNYILNHLNPEDRFNIIAFSTGIRKYASGLRPAEEAAEAQIWIEALAVRGSTDINLALLEAIGMASASRPTMIIFLTDGLPTEGVVEAEQILGNVDEAAGENIRLFSFGVGYDVDTYLLDSLSKSQHGTTTYVTGDQAIDEAISGFYAKITDPILMDLSLDFGDIRAYDMYPEPLPDLFAGTQLVLTGRYKGSGFETISLSGRFNQETHTFRYEDQRFRSSGGSDFVPRLWATRKIGYLLNQMRLSGAEQELVDQVVRLSIRFGIITPYTSFLVTEDDVLGDTAQDSIAEEAFEGIASEPSEVYGKNAVERAEGEAGISSADVPMTAPSEAKDSVQIAGNNTFKLQGGVWVDTRFNPETMTALRIPFLSEAYFELAASDPQVAAAFAIGEQVIIVHGGEAYQIIDENATGDVIEIPQEQPEEDEQASEIESPSELQNHESSHTNTLCPGVALTLAFVVVPWSRRFR